MSLWQKVSYFVLILALLGIVIWAFVLSRQLALKPNSNNTATSTDDLSKDKPLRNLLVSSPTINEAVGLPLLITGQARVFENTFAYRLKNGDGSVLLERSAMSQSPDAGIFGSFSLSVNYPAPKNTSGIVEVFEYSAKDGAEINKTIIPVTFKTVETQIVKTFFLNTKNDPNMLDCAKVFPLERRIAKTTGVARAAIEELLLGPDRLEGQAGFSTSINSGVKINKLTIVDGIARVDFNEMLEAGVAGSCLVTSIRSQITETLKQFSSVKSVVISIDDHTEDILQP